MYSLSMGKMTDEEIKELFDEYAKGGSSLTE